MDTTSKEATLITKTYNRVIGASLNFDNDDDFHNASRGLLCKEDKLVITDKDGGPVWNMDAYTEFITPEADCPDTVNPSLWRNAQLCVVNGLFRVHPHIYQVRGYDLSNITFVKGNEKWIVFDPLISKQTSARALQLVESHFGKRDIAAVVFSHSHVDHYGGVRGIVSQDDIRNNDIKIIASEGFTESAVSENVIAGNAMARRAVFMYGSDLEIGPKGGVNSGLGQTTSTGTPGMIVPNDLIRRSKSKRCIDGVNMEFQFTPGTEAPTEMNTWFPDWNCLWMAENSTNTMHNILTLRGALVRDAQKWAYYLNETLELYGSKATVKFQSHHWPVWGNRNIVEYLKKQRDCYKFIHDQSVRLMNQGYTGSEIADELRFPPSLNQNWSTREYYGTLRHNSRAVYQRYMGWYNGNPSDLNNLPPEPAAIHYVEYMGGEAAIIEKAHRDYNLGKYRWVAEALKHVVFANPDSVEGKGLLADTLEQMGYQAESGPWRSVYLQGARELRFGNNTGVGPETMSADTLRNMEATMLFDYIAVRVNCKLAEGLNLNFNVNLIENNPDSSEGQPPEIVNRYTIYLENSVMNYSTIQIEDAMATITTTKNLFALILFESDIFQFIQDHGLVVIDDENDVLKTFFDTLDTFEYWFNIVTP